MFCLYRINNTSWTDGFCFDLKNIQEVNRDVVKDKLSSAVVRSRPLTGHQIGHIVVFMINHFDQIWDLPSNVTKAIELQVTQLASGIVPIKQGEKQVLNVSSI